MEKKMNSSINSAEAYAPPVMSFAGLENISQKQLWDVEQATHYQQLPYFLTDTPFLDSSATTLLPMSNYPFYQPTPAAGDCPGDLLTKGKEDGGAGRLGLNLGHRTYIPSPAGAAGIDWLFRRSRAGTHHQSSQLAAPPPRCQAEGCKADLSGAKYYHRRHKVCEFHSKATVVVVAGGVQQRFCQQCSRFHVLSEFDETKRSCRKRLADHNRRRRKPPPLTTTATAAATLEHSPPQDLNVTSSTQKSSKSIQDKSTTAEGTTTTTTTTVSSTVSTSNLSSPSLESPALSLGGAGGADNAAGFGFHSSSSNYHHHHYQMVHISSSSSSSSSSAFFNPHNFFRSSSNGASHSAATGGGPSDPANQHHHGGGGSNLLHLGQGLFEVDFI